MKTTSHFIAIAFFLCSFSFYGQGKREKIRSLKVSFLTEQLALTPAEAEKFWPIYNAYEEKQYEIRSKKLKNLRSRFDANPESLSDAEALELLTQMDDTETRLYENKKKLSQSLKGILSPVKILKLRKSEDDFNRKLLKQYRKKS